MRIHPFAKDFPEMSEGDFAQLVADIKTSGLRQPITLFQGQILDGRHRLKACRKAGVEPTFITFGGDKRAARAYVMSLNVHRRHLTMDQKRKMVTDELNRDPQQTDRAIAKKVNVSPSTVAKKRANVQNGHKTERSESSGRKARGRKPKPAQEPMPQPPPPANVTKPMDLEAKRIIEQISKIEREDLSDPASFTSDLFREFRRLSPQKFVLQFNGGGK